MIGLPIGTIVVYIVKVTPHFYWYLWAVSLLMMAFFIVLYPRWILPLFDEHVSLPEGPLRRGLTQLAEKCGFPLKDVVILRESNRTAHTLTYFVEFDRIVLSDNFLRTYLIEHASENAVVHPSPQTRAEIQAEQDLRGVGCTEEEIVALVAHEMGHWKANHLWWNVLLAFVNLGCFFGAFSAYYNSSVMYEAFHFPKASKKPILIGLFIVFNHILDTVNFVTDLALRKVARVCILKADLFAVKLGYGDPLRRAILKTNIDDYNIGEFDPIYTFYFLDRPSLSERLQLIDAQLRKMQ
ncbi:CAAX prenyl protease 1 homolog [Folsomia candida]|nr:CAAX prenyl protease 1 homolog [Folsomia candida]